MAAPTQELPEWYTVSTTTLTDAAGLPTGTSTTLLYLPLTYYGPSIPLGPEWTYGGLFPPGSTETLPPSSVSTTNTASTEPSFMPTVSPTVSSTATPTATPSNTSTPATESMTSTSGVPEPSTPASNLSARNRNIAIIVGTVLGFLFLVSVACLAFCWLTRFRSRSRASTQRARISDESFAFFPSSYTIEDEMRRERERGEQREMGEGSPRHSGEEVDPFLQPHSHYTTHPEMGQLHPRTGLIPAPAMLRDSVSSHPQTLNTMTNTSTTGSGYGNIIPSPYTTDPETLNAIFSQQRGHILSPEEIRRISDESIKQSQQAQMSTAHSLPLPPTIRTVPPSDSQHEADEDVSPLLPPPPVSYRPNSTAFSSHTTLDQEQAELLTAQRVHVQRSPPPALRDLQPVAGPSSWRDKIPFFKNMGSSSSIDLTAPPGSRPASGLLSFVPDSLGSYQPLDSEMSGSGNRRSMLASRPVSGVSAASGGTTYYDAKSSLGTSGRGTPVSASEFGRMSPMPRAHTSNSGRDSPVPPVPPLPAGFRSHYDLPSADADFLDAPVPRAVAFRSPLKPESRYATPRVPFLPSGLKFGILGHRSTPSNDVLEDEPPRAVQPWQAMSSSTSRASPLGDNRRATFGHSMPVVVNASPQASSYGSRSTGSAPSAYLSATAQSRRDIHGSSSSRGTQSSLSHSGSVSSHGRRRGQFSSSTAGSRGPTSPALSAFGPGISPAPTPPPASHLRQYRSDTEMVDGAYMPGTSITDSDTLVYPGSASVAPSGEPIDEFPDLPWAGGLDKDWRPISPPTRF